MNTINLKSEELNLPIGSMSFDIKINVDDFCELFAALQAKTLPAPNSVGFWYVIDENSEIDIKRICEENGVLLVAEHGDNSPPCRGRWVKITTEWAFAANHGLRLKRG